MVEVRDGANVQKVQLSARFLELIDLVAMRLSLVGSDAYLAQWRRVKHDDRAGDVSAIASTVAAELELRYNEFRAKAIAEPKGG